MAEHTFTARDGHEYRMTDCCNCGVIFAMPERIAKQRREDGKNFYCPNGHPMVYRESEADKLRRERDSLKQETARLEEEAAQARRDAAAARDAAASAEKKVSKLKKRAAAGSCPACKRTFANMAQHMKHMHPDFVCESGAKVVPIRRQA